MKKNIVRTLVLLLLIGGAVAYLFSPNSPFKGLHEIVDPAESVISYIPAVFDQVLILDVDQELRDVAVMSNDLEDKDSFVGLLGTLEEVVVYQGSTPDEVFNVLIMQGNEAFEIEEVVAMGLLVTDDNFDHKKIGEGIWAYGSDSGISYLERTLANSKALDNEDFRVFNRARRSGKYNVGFFSRPDASTQTNPLAIQFAERLEYTSLLSHINATDPSGRLTMQFVDGTIKAGGTPLAAKIINRVSKKPGFFMEISDILSVAGVDKNQVKLYAPVLLSQLGAESGINAENLDALANGLEGNIAIALMPSVLSPIQLGGHLVFDSPDMFATLQKLTPAFEGLVDMITGGAQAMDMSQVVTDNEVTYAVTTGTGEAALSFPLVQLTKQADSTTLSILTQGELEYASSGVIPVPSLKEETRVRFGWDAGLLQQNFLQAQLGNGDAAQQLFQTGSVQGTIDLLPVNQQVRIEFSATQ